MDHPIPLSAHPGVLAVHGAMHVDRELFEAAAGSGWFPDLSEFNGPPDWDALEAAYRAGVISAVAMRAGFGTVRPDAQFARNQAEARRRGIPIIYYWFCYPAYNTPGAEADTFNRVVGPLGPGEAMCGDFEDDPGAKPFPRGLAGLDWCRGFLTALQAPQNATWWYTYPFLLSTVGLQALETTWPFWEADYSATPDSAFAPIVARQFTDCGSTPGVGGCCDQSRVVRGPLSQWLTPGAPGGNDVPLDPNDPNDGPVISAAKSWLNPATAGSKSLLDELSETYYGTSPGLAGLKTQVAALLSVQGVEKAAIDALAANGAAASAVAALAASQAQLKAELDGVAGAVASGTPPDLTALGGAVAAVDAHVAALSAHLGVGTA